MRRKFTHNKGDRYAIAELSTTNSSALIGVINGIKVVGTALVQLMPKSVYYKIIVQL